MVSQLKCLNKCCTLRHTRIKINQPEQYLRDTSEHLKCGIFLLDSEDRILLSQSYNALWGIPKGNQEKSESFVETTLRETFEETGLFFGKRLFNHKVTIHLCYIHTSVYLIFLIKIPYKGPDSSKDPFLLGTESTGCGWVKISCLKELHSKYQIRLNCITKIILEKVTAEKWVRVNFK